MVNFLIILTYDIFDKYIPDYAWNRNLQAQGKPGDMRSPARIRSIRCGRSRLAAAFRRETLLVFVPAVSWTDKIHLEKRCNL